MPETLVACDFLAIRQQGLPILDVRSPSEFKHSRIPGALSFPLFSDEERHEVGYLYKQVSQSAAMVKGLEIAGPKMAAFVQQAMTIAPDQQVAVYCLRGGKRSGSMAWLLENSGFTAFILQGGYKAARRYFLDALVPRYPLVRVGGRTGSGKTRILEALREAGEQVIDLEGMAHHRGSAFGHLGLAPQPSNEYFENKIGDALALMDKDRVIWVEDESRHIGRRSLPQPFWQHLIQAPVIFLDVSADLRVQEILQEYGTQDTEGLKEAFKRIARKMGPQFVKAALAHLDSGDLEAAARLALAYYDKSYDFHLVNQTFGEVIEEKVDQLDAKVLAARLIDRSKQYEKAWMNNG
ncbi:MAG: tRNA 2-selenouridine(34) synthase MnmH [Saprospiraceae bacterium]|nr:tRNA 2-selenouridine(34) synthase MnmH [Saprospiraceae bacterium]